MSIVGEGASLFSAPWPAERTVMLWDRGVPPLLNLLPYLNRWLLPFSSSSSVSVPSSKISSLFLEATLRRLPAVLWRVDARLDFPLERRLEVVLILDVALFPDEARLDLLLLAVDKCDRSPLLLDFPLFPETALKFDFPLLFEPALDARLDFPLFPEARLEARLDFPLLCDPPLDARLDFPLFADVALKFRLDFPLLFDPAVVPRLDFPLFPESRLPDRLWDLIEMKQYYWSSFFHARKINKLSNIELKVCLKNKILTLKFLGEWNSNSQVASKFVFFLLSLRR